MALPTNPQVSGILAMDTALANEGLINNSGVLASVQGLGAPTDSSGLSTPAAQSASNALYNQYLANASGGSALQAAGITPPASAAPASSTPTFSWLDPWAWFKAEALNGILIVLGVITVIIVIGAIFRQATRSAPARYVGGSVQTIGQGAAAAKSGVSKVAEAVGSAAEVAA